MPKLKSKLPPLYHPFFPDFIENTLPEEKWATCDQCVRCRTPASPYMGTKCCDYYPHLANYLVGGILQDKRPEMAEGRSRIQALIRAQAGITPYGILPPKGYTAQRKENYKNPLFASGKPLREIKEEAVALRCPYLHEGSCTIWDYRANLCSTHFCISVGGVAGKMFWKETNSYLKMTENILSCYAVRQLGDAAWEVDSRPIADIDFGPENSAGKIDPDRYTQLWQEWEGKEAEFYVRCYEIIGSMDRQTFLELGGPEQDTLAQNLQSALGTFKHSLIPEHLILHPDLYLTHDLLSEYTLTLGSRSTRLNSVYYTFVAKFDGKRTTTEIIDQALLVMLNLVPTIDELRQKQMLVPVTAARP